MPPSNRGARTGASWPYRQLCALVVEEMVELQREAKELPRAATRPMREALPSQ